ncbi:hypothetical protein ACF0H5_005073 [Mactra antiquata]
MSRFLPPISYHDKYRKPAVTYRGESLGAKMHELSNFPYTYAYDVPGVIPYHRSLYGRAIRSDYGYRSPFVHQSEMFGYRYPYNFAESEVNYYRDYYHHPRYSRYYDYCK